MIEHATAEGPSADEVIDRLSQIADYLIAARGLLGPLDMSEFDPLRLHTDLVLMEVGRCIARRVATPDAAREARAPEIEYGGA